MDQSALLTFAASKQFVSRFTVASLGLLFYDYLLTVDQEAKYVWDRPWTPGKVIFLIIRYLPFMDLPMNLYSDTTSSPADVPGNIANWWFGVSGQLGTILANAVIGLRTWAIWNRNPFCGVFVFVAWLATLIPATYYLGVFCASLVSAPRVAGVPGCMHTSMEPDASPKIYIPWFIYQALIFLLTAVRGITHLLNNRAPLTTVVYRDAFLASSCLLTVSLISIILLYNAPDFAFALFPLYRVMDVVLPCRIILNIRETLLSLHLFDVTTSQPSTSSSSVGVVDIGAGDSKEEGRADR